MKINITPVMELDIIKEHRMRWYNSTCIDNTKKQMLKRLQNEDHTIRDTEEGQRWGGKIRLQRASRGEGKREAVKGKDEG